MSETPTPPVHPYARRILVLLTALVASAVVAAGLLGALIAHTVWKSSAPAGSEIVLPSAAADPATGASDTGVAAKIDPALVDVNSELGYQGAGGAGTGIVVSSDGEVLTNNHVVEGATRITATDVGNGKTYTATVVGYDPTHDLAVLQLQGASGLATATLGDSSQVGVGDPVVGVGNAGGAGGTPSAAEGTVTALDATVTAADDLSQASETLTGLIETDAPIEAGDSGGALVDASGRVIGINTAGSADYRFGASTTRAYAIPIDTAVEVAKQVESGKGSDTVHVGPTAFLGVELSSAGDGGFGGAFGAQPTASGVAVGRVVDGDPAQDAGLEAGDTITSLDGRLVGSQADVAAILIRHHPGDEIAIGWTDVDGQAHTATVTLASGPAA